MDLNTARGLRALNTGGTTGADALASDIESSTEIGKGWRSAGLGGAANELWTQAAKAGLEGREADRQILEAQARDADQQAAQWAPRVQNVSDVRSLRDAADWVGGALGNVRTSVAPAVGGLVGGTVGLAAAPLTGGVINPVNAGFAGSALAGYGMEADEAIAGGMRDPVIRANKTYDDILNAGRVKGVVNAGLEALVPAAMGGKILGTGAKAVVGAGWKGAAKTVGKEMLEGGAGEFATEGAQSLSGQAAQNYLRDDALDTFDYGQALNEAAAGAVAGHAMGAVGGAADVGHARLEAGVDKTKGIAKDPAGALADGVADLGHAAGTLGAKALNWYERASSPPHRAFDALISAQPAADDVMDARAMEWAGHVLQTRDSSPEEIAAAKDFVLAQSKGDANAWRTYRDKLTIDHHEAKNAAADQAIADEFAGGKPSLMRGTLTDDFGEQEGRDPSDDGVVDDYGTRVRSGMDGADAAAHAQLSQIGQPVLPRQNPVTRGADLPALESTADIWRKQGVADKLLTATSDKTDPAQRQMAIGLLGWVARGFKDADGEVFVPESLTKRYGAKAPKMIQSAAKLAFEQGIIGHDEASMTPQIMQMAQLQHADATAVNDAVLGALPEYARTLYKPHIEDIKKLLRKVAAEGATKREDEALLDAFGSKEAVAQAMSKLPDPESRYGGKAPGFDNAATQVVRDADERVEGGVDYESRLDERAPETRVTYKGLGGKDTPWNTMYADKKADLAGALSTLQNDLGVFARKIGVYDAIKEQYDKNHPYRRTAENEALWRAVRRGNSDVGKEQYLADIEKLTSDEREQQLKALNRTHKLLRVEQATEDVADQIRPDQVESFREDRGEWSPDVTAARGMLYLEREGTGEVNKETGEIENEHFLTSTAKLVKFSHAVESRGRSMVEPGKGALGTYRHMLRGLGALLASDGTFSSRVGVKATPGSDIQWFDIASLPNNLKIGGTNKNPVTVEHAKQRASTELRAGHPMNFVLREKSTVAGKRKELTRLANAKNILYPLKKEVEDVLALNNGDAVETLYDRLFDDWNGEHERANVEPGDVVPTDRDRTPTEHAREPEIYRNTDGARVGLGTDAEGAGYEGHAALSEKAADPASAPLATIQTPARIDTYPFDAELQKKLVESRGDLGVRKPDDREKGFINAALRELSRRGLGPQLGQLAHLFMFTTGKHNALFMGWAHMDKGAAIGLNATTLSTLKADLFNSIPEQVRYVLAHELGHNADLGDGKVGQFSTHPGYEMGEHGAVGALAKEMEAAALNVENPLHKLLVRTPFKQEYIGRPAAAQRELFAQGYAMYTERRDEMREHLPLNFAHMEALYGRNNTVQSSTQTVGKRSGTQPNSNSSVQAGNNTGTSSRDGVQTGRTVGDERTATGRTTRDQLQAYLTKTTGKNALLAGALRHEIERLDAGGKPNGNTTGVLAAAAKQFGALEETSQTTEAQADPTDRLLKTFTEPFAAAKTPREKISTLFNEVKSLLNDHTEQGAFGHWRLTNTADGALATAKYLDAMFSAELSLADKMGDKQATAVSEMLVKAYRAFQATYGKHVRDVLEGKQNAQTANDGTGKRASKEQVAAAKQHILDTLGDSVKLSFTKHFGDNSSGLWTPGAVKSTITLALNSANVVGTAFHESMHEFVSLLRKAGDEGTQAILKRVATNNLLLRKMEILLKDHPEAAAQLRADPDEAVAYMYQFWRAGLLKLGPETQTFFEKVKAFVAQILGRVSREVRDAQQAEAIMTAFSNGAVKEDAMREVILQKLRESSEAHEAALERADKAGRDLVRAFGKLVFSSEAMMKATKNKWMRSLAEDFNQESGTAKGEKQALFDATKQQMNIWTNRLDNILNGADEFGMKYTKEDLELARQALSSGTPAKDRVAKQIVARIEAFNEAMFKYVSERGVSRWDDETRTWVPVEHRKDYFRRVWNTDAVREGADKFREMLIKHHSKELESIAREANGELARNETLDPGFASQIMKAKPTAEQTLVTPEHVADAIIARLLNANGQIELSESTSSLGMTPVATSVNRRSLSWIDAGKFDEFLSHDLVNIMSGYVASMVKRAEHTRVFGVGAEKLKAKVDKAVLHEMAGDTLVSEAERALPDAIDAWRKAARAAHEAGVPFDEPFPTLRSVGQKAHFAKVGQDKGLQDLTQALKDLDQATKAVMAMEGTLGADISPAHRSANSLLMTYQSLRVLPLILFSSINDIMGIVAQDGGELKDAWHALVAGMREIRLRWKDEKSDTAASRRAEEWGTVDAGSFLDTLGQTYNSMYFTGKFKRLSDSFFKWNGMEAWNRATRITATSVAERAITALKTEGVESSDKAAQARVEALFGKGFDVKNIKLDAKGRLDANDPANQAAMMRWVSNAIMSPNAAHRTIWGSDPRMAPFWMLKQFAYTFHRVMLKNTIAQAKLGNYRPAMVLALGYAPVAIAADAVKEMLVPGDEPPWMKMGLGAYLQHGIDRAGIFGVPGMIYDSVSYDYGVGLLGPTVGQLAHLPFDPVDESLVGALPAGGRLKKLVQD